MHTVLSTSAAKEQAMLGHWAGARDDDDAARTGAALVALARSGGPARPQPTSPNGLLDRIRGVLAA